MKQSTGESGAVWRGRRGVPALALALLLAFGALAPLAVHGSDNAQPAATAASTAGAPTADAAAADDTPKRGGGSKLGRVLGAPFRALARLFGGGKKDSAEEARKKEERRKQEEERKAAERAAAERAAAERAAAEQARLAEARAALERKAEEARAARESRERRKQEKKSKKADAARQQAQGAQPAAVGPAEIVESAKSVSPLQAAQTANVVRPGANNQPPPGVWIPVIEGIPKDHLSQGRALLQHGYLNEAVSELSVASAVGPDLVEANNLLGMAYDRTGQHKQAIEAYERALTVAPDDPKVLNNLGYSLYLENDLKAALKRLRQADRVAPGAPAILNNIGLVQAKLGKYDDAYKSFARAGGEYNARLLIAEVLEKAGREREAIKHYEAALRAQPNTAAVLERLVALYERTGRKTEAEAARRALGQPKNPQKTTTGGGGGGG